jgi:hypothetical protein
MNESGNVFISWSGRRSLWVAEALRDWLPIILEAAAPWVSAKDIDKGSRGLFEVTKALNGMKVAIVCLTPENQTEPWILFEAGALSKTIDEKSRLCTYLLGGLQNQDVKPPLGMFQHTKSDEEDTFLLIQTINKAINERPVPEHNLRRRFDGFWPDLKKRLDAMPAPEEVVEPSRPVEEVMAEILELTRAAANQRKKTDALDAYIPVFADLLPLFVQLRNSVMHGQDLATIGWPTSSASGRKDFLIRASSESEPKHVVGTNVWRGRHGGIDVYDGPKRIASFGRDAEVLSETDLEVPPKSTDVR